MTRQTSIAAYNEIKANGLLSWRRFEVYDVLFHHGPLTAHEVVAVLRQTHPVANQTSFNARLSELEKQGCVFISGEKKNETSGFMNKLWDVTDRLPIKFEKPRREMCKACCGRGFTEYTQSKFDF